MRRLFSTFAAGWPGAGLLLLRLVAGSAAVIRSGASLAGGHGFGPLLHYAIAMLAGILLLAGLWTPASGSACAIFGFWDIILAPADPWANLLLGAIGAALAMTGPGVWSVDARLFGWKRIDLSNRPFE